MKGIVFVSVGTISEETKKKFAEMKKRREAKLEKMAENFKNWKIEKP